MGCLGCWGVFVTRISIYGPEGNTIRGQGKSQESDRGVEPGVEGWACKCRAYLMLVPDTLQYKAGNSVGLGFRVQGFGFRV